MVYGWNELLSVLPFWLRQELNSLDRENLREIRLRSGQQPLILSGERHLALKRCIEPEDIQFCVNTATKYSPWAADTIQDGYISAPGGHRIGLCGEAIGYGQDMRGLKNIRSVCIRIAGDFPGIASGLKDRKGSILILGRPGSGKTTLLRDLVRQLSTKENVCVIDQRGELFPPCFCSGVRTDILTGCSKEKAIDILLRTMSPDTIAMDEITKDSDCEAMQHAAWCGVRLIATAHAADGADLRKRSVYKSLIRDGIFDTLVVMNPDKTWRAERM